MGNCTSTAVGAVVPDDQIQNTRNPLHHSPPQCVEGGEDTSVSRSNVLDGTTLSFSRRRPPRASIDQQQPPHPPSSSHASQHHSSIVIVSGKRTDGGSGPLGGDPASIFCEAGVMLSRQRTSSSFATVPQQGGAVQPSSLNSTGTSSLVENLDIPSSGKLNAPQGINNSISVQESAGAYPPRAPLAPSSSPHLHQQQVAESDDFSPVQNEDDAKAAHLRLLKQFPSMSLPKLGENSGSFDHTNGQGTLPGGPHHQLQQQQHPPALLPTPSNSHNNNNTITLSTNAINPLMMRSMAQLSGQRSDGAHSPQPPTSSNAVGGGGRLQRMPNNNLSASVSGSALHSPRPPHHHSIVGNNFAEMRRAQMAVVQRALLKQEMDSSTTDMMPVLRRSPSLAHHNHPNYNNNASTSSFHHNSNSVSVARRTSSHHQQSSFSRGGGTAHNGSRSDLTTFPHHPSSSMLLCLDSNNNNASPGRSMVSITPQQQQLCTAQDFLATAQQGGHHHYRTTDGSSFRSEGLSGFGITPGGTVTTTTTTGNTAVTSAPGLRFANSSSSSSVGGVLTSEHLELEIVRAVARLFATAAQRGERPNTGILQPPDVVRIAMWQCELVQPPQAKGDNPSCAYLDPLLTEESE